MKFIVSTKSVDSDIWNTYNLFNFYLFKIIFTHILAIDKYLNFTLFNLENEEDDDQIMKKKKTNFFISNKNNNTLILFLFQLLFANFCFKYHCYFNSYFYLFLLLYNFHFYFDAYFYFYFHDYLYFYFFNFCWDWQ
jgi:hypothetical protein